MVHLREILFWRARFAGSSSRPSAVPAWVVAVAVALAPFLGDIHFSLVEHRVCDTHNAVEHGSDHGDDLQGPEDRSDHDDCSIQLMGPVSREVTAPSSAALDLTAQRNASRVPPPPVRPRDRLWLRAPKGSPPA